MKLNPVFKVFLGVCSYLLAARVGLHLATFSNTSPIWPASGLAVGGLFFFGRRLWPSILIGSFLANYFMPTALFPSACIAAGNTAEALLGCWLAHRLIFRGSLPQLQRNPFAIILTAILPAALSASVGILTLVLSDRILFSQSYNAWLIWWSGDLLGILAIFPIFFLLHQKNKWNPNVFHRLLSLALTSGLTYVIFFLTHDLIWVYSLFPILLFVCLFIGNLELKFSVVIICGLSVLATTQGRGPFASSTFSHDLVSLQVFLASVLLLSLFLGNIRNYRPLKTPPLVLLLCLGLTALLAVSFKKNIDTEEMLAANQTVESIQEHIQETAILYENTLTSTIGFMQSSSRVSQDDWRNFLAPFHFLQSFPGILGMAVAIEVQEKDLEKFRRTHSLPERKDKTPRGRSTSGSQILVTLIEPFKPLSRFRGFDMGFEPQRRKTFDLAATTGKTLSTGRLILRDEPTNTFGFLLIKAFYKNSQIDQAAQKNLAGFVYAPIGYEQLFGRFFRSFDERLDFWVLEGQEVRPENLVFSRGNQPLMGKDYKVTKSVKIGEKELRILWQFSPSFIRQGTRWAAWITLAGILFSILISSLLLGFQNIFRQADEIASEMTLKLKHSEDQIRSINLGLEETIRDRTRELETTLASLQDSEKNFRELADSMPQIVWINSSDGQNVFMNKRWYEFSGFSINQSAQVRLTQITHPDERERIQSLWEQSLKEEKLFETQLRLWDYRSRIYRWFLTRSVPSFDEDHCLRRWIGTSTDIHQQKLLELEQQKLGMLVEHSPDAMVLFGRNGEIVYTNVAAQATFGLLDGERYLIQELFLDPTFYKDELAALLESEGKWEQEIMLRNVTEDHEVITYSYAFQILDELTAAPLLTAFVSRDISDLKSAEFERSDFRAREQAAIEASRIKSEFLANMSHEIRTPISGILGLTNILKKTNPTDEQKELLTSLENSGHTLLELINDILDLSKIEAGKLEFEAIDFDLHELIDGVRRHFIPLAAEKKIDLSLDLEGKLPRLVNGDPLKLKQVLTNLLSNALKFSERGEVRITSYVASENLESYLIHFSVKDQGIGISQENQLRLFTAFTQADSSTTRRYGGSGLGLSISQHLVSGMKGQIGLTSELGKGSVFWFKIILQHPLGSTVDESKDDLFSLSGLRFLVAEDNPVNQRIILHTLVELGASAVMVENGAQAIESLKLERPDIILMDCQMPLMDGYEATRRIRAGSSGVQAQKLPIIAVTANALKGDREKCLEAGMSDFLSKPVVAADICRVVRTWIPENKIKFLNQKVEFPKDYDQEMITGLKEIFLETAPEALAKLSSSLETRDSEKLAFELHKFKSSLMALGLYVAAELCTKMEEDLARGDFASLEVSFARVEDLVRMNLEKYQE
jgi:PAS domain S-box-containing protein